MFLGLISRDCVNVITDVGFRAYNENSRWSTDRLSVHLLPKLIPVLLSSKTNFQMAGLAYPMDEIVSTCIQI